MKYQILSLCCILIVSLACNKPADTEANYSLENVSEKGIKVVIEIPAGTNHKMELNKDSGKIENDQENGKDRVINFLPYPGNYGYIPSTMMDEDRGGDGDALDVLVISESQKTGTIMAVIPIASLDLRDGGEIDTKIIAIPADPALRVIKSTNFQEFAVEYPMAKQIIKNWFLSYKGLGEMEFMGWRNEQVALAEIKKWSKAVSQ